MSAPSREQPSRFAIDDIVQQLDRPPIERRKLHEIRVGLRPATPDGLPILGRVPQLDNVFIATGHGIEGVLPDALCKRIVNNDIVPNFKGGNYFNGLSAATITIMGLVKGEYTAEEYMRHNRLNRSAPNDGLATTAMDNHPALRRGRATVRRFGPGSRSPAHAAELIEWTDRFMASSGLDETAEERRLRHAACLLVQDASHVEREESGNLGGRGAGRGQAAEIGFGFGRSDNCRH